MAKGSTCNPRPMTHDPDFFGIFLAFAAYSGYPNPAFRRDLKAAPLGQIERQKQSPCLNGTSDYRRTDSASSNSSDKASSGGRDGADMMDSFRPAAAKRQIIS